MMRKILLLFIFPYFSVCLFAQVPVPGENRSPFGAQTVWPSDDALVTFYDRMEQAGIQWTRFDLIWWGLCEHTKGEYDFTSPDVPGWEDWDVDRAVSLLQERNIEIFPT